MVLGRAMKRILFTVPILLLAFYANTSYSQNVNAAKTVDSLIPKLQADVKELETIMSDLHEIKQIENDRLQKEILESLFGATQQAILVCEYQALLILVMYDVKLDKLKSYFKLLKLSFSKSKENLNYCFGMASGSYRFLKLPSALHTTDKLKKNLRDTLDEFESIIEILNNAIKSMP